MKFNKFLLIVSVSVIFSLCLPSIPVLAASVPVGVVTHDSVVESPGEFHEYALDLFAWDNSYFEGIDLDRAFSLVDFPEDCYWVCSFSYSSGRASTLKFRIFQASYDYSYNQGYLVVNSSKHGSSGAVNSYGKIFCVTDADNYNKFSLKIYSVNLSSYTVSVSNYTVGNGLHHVYDSNFHTISNYGGSTGDYECFCCGNLKIIDTYYLYNSGLISTNSNTTSISNLQLWLSDSLPFLGFEGLLLYNGSEIFDPEGGDIPNIESNANHMYFKSCDIGFAEPYGSNNFYNFGGAYFYSKYTFDDWIMNHITDYTLRLDAQALVGDRQFSGSKTVRLDTDGAITIPFSDIFGSKLVEGGIVSAVTNKFVDSGFYKTYLYSVANSKLQDFASSLESSGGLSSSWSDFLNGVKQGFLLVATGVNSNDTFSSSVFNSVNAVVSPVLNQYTNYKIRVQVKLIDNSGNESGAVARLFDLYSGYNNSVDNAGLVNDNPYNPDLPDDILPELPADVNSYPVVNTGSGGYVVNNYINVPNNIAITYRDGVNDFIDWFQGSDDQETLQNSFWSSFGIFKNNPVSDLYKEYFGFLPTGFKALIFSCAAIGLIGGVVTVLRKRLMK